MQIIFWSENVSKLPFHAWFKILYFPKFWGILLQYLNVFLSCFSCVLACNKTTNKYKELSGSHYKDNHPVLEHTEPITWPCWSLQNPPISHNFWVFNISLYLFFSFSTHLNRHVESPGVLYLMLTFGWWGIGPILWWCCHTSGCLLGSCLQMHIFVFPSSPASPRILKKPNWTWFKCCRLWSYLLYRVIVPLVFQHTLGSRR